MKRPFLFGYIAALFLLVCGGCTQKLDISSMNVRADFEGQGGNIIVVVQDRRGFVLSGKKEPNYIGVDEQQGINGPQKTLICSSERSLAEEISLRLASGLRRDRYQVETLTVPHSDETPLADPRLKTADFDRLLVFTMNNFIGRMRNATRVLSIPPFYTELKWNFDLTVYDRSLQPIAEAQNSGIDDKLHEWQAFGSVSRGKAQTAIAKKLASILEEMLRSPNVQRVLEDMPKRVAGKDPEGMEQGTEGGEAENSSGNSTISELEEYIKNQDEAGFQSLAKNLFTEGVDDRVAVDELAEMVWVERRNNNPKIVDGLCYFCRIIEASKDGRYKPFLTMLAQDEDATAKLRKYARKMGARLPDDSSQPPFQPNGLQLP
ncbi:MAG: hypothetical protein CSB23_01935 [Deltaproteobacteria bacterium]|nr:MAG: hypothetical protein CSB23_01935 [Deltaproteobacteria bacterium]